MNDLRLNLKLHSAIAAGILCVTMAMGVLAAPAAAGPMLGQLGDILAPMKQVGPVALIALVFFNNALKALAVIVTGVLGGVPPLVFVAVNGAVIGIVAGGASVTQGSAVVVAGLAPHGIIEIPAVVVATALGFELGRQSFNWLLQRPSNVREKLRGALRLYGVALAPALLVAAVIEVLATPLVVGLVR